MVNTSYHSSNYGFGEKEEVKQPKGHFFHTNSSKFSIIHSFNNLISSIKNIFVKPVLNTNTNDKTIKYQQMSHSRVGDWTKDNSILITQGAEETNHWKLEFIKHAKQSIEISGSICGGKVFREALNAIRDRIKECPDLKVHILTTPDLLESEDRVLIKEITKQYPDNSIVLSLGSILIRNCIEWKIM